jgi:hypothetical protein
MPTPHDALGWFPREVSPRDVFIGEPAANCGREADFFASVLSGDLPFPQPE